MTTILNTHALYKELINVGLTESQANVVVENFATTEDITEIKSEFVKKSDLDVVVNRLEAKIDKLEIKLETKIDVSIAKLETSIIKWNLAFLLTLAGLFLAYLRYMQ